MSIKNKLIKLGLMLACNAVFLPLSYLAVTHGSSSGLDIAITLIILCVSANVVIVKAK